jgi:hypothetical protein
VPVFVDGRRAGRCRVLKVTIQPDCFTLIA